MINVQSLDINGFEQTLGLSATASYSMCDDLDMCETYGDDTTAVYVGLDELKKVSRKQTMFAHYA